LKKFKQWIENKWTKPKTNRLVPLAKRVELEQNFYSLSDDRFLNVRMAIADDVTDILEIEKRCYNGKTPWNRSALTHEIQYNKNAFYIIVHDKNKPVAFLGSWFLHDEAHITNIATVPDYERQGIATFLIEQLVDIAKKEQVHILSLECRVSNEKAQHLYRKLGFEDGRVKKGYYANDQEDALEMAMKLQEEGKLQKDCEGDVSPANK
jgi:ribosomal-protein-alanine N-acetyltransferase